MGLTNFFKSLVGKQMSLREQAEKMVENHMYWSAGGGIIPVPLLDIAAVTAVQVNMIRQLCDLYGQEFDEGQVKALVTALVGTSFAKLGASAIKAIPLIGSLLGSVSMAIVSGATTYAVGHVFVKHFEKGGSLENFVATDFRAYYEELFEEGKDKAKEVVEHQQQKQNNNVEVKNNGMVEIKEQYSLVDQLKELSELKEKGAIDEDEFVQIKEKLLTSLK